MFSFALYVSHTHDHALNRLEKFDWLLRIFCSCYSRENMLTAGSVCYLSLGGLEVVAGLREGTGLPRAGMADAGTGFRACLGSGLLIVLGST